VGVIGSVEIATRMTVFEAQDELNKHAAVQTTSEMEYF
jgi:hypothetical protein